MHQIPNILTLTNLFFGCCAIVCILNGFFIEGVVFSVGSNVADFLDGAVARGLGVSSAVGKELDSLADVVSFGVVPGLIFYVFLNDIFINAFFYGVNIPASIAFLIPVMSGYRLAKFNLDTRQTDNFIGLPVPASTLFTLGLLLIYIHNPFGLSSWLEHWWVLVPMIFVLSWLLVSEIAMFSLKIKNFKWAGNEIRFIFVAVAVAEVFILKYAALTFIVLTYLLLSVFLNFYKKQ